MLHDLSITKLLPLERNGWSLWTVAYPSCVGLQLEAGNGTCKREAARFCRGDGEHGLPLDANGFTSRQLLAASSQRQSAIR